MTDDHIIIAGHARTPMAGFRGVLSGFTAVQLGATAVKAGVDRAGVGPAAFDRIHRSRVLPAGLGQAPARQAALGAGLDDAYGKGKPMAALAEDTAGENPTPLNPVVQPPQRITAFLAKCKPRFSGVL